MIQIKSIDAMTNDLTELLSATFCTTYDDKTIGQHSEKAVRMISEQQRIWRF